MTVEIHEGKVVACMVDPIICIGDQGMKCHKETMITKSKENAQCSEAPTDSTVVPAMYR